jgi:hypothetical protein
VPLALDLASLESSPGSGLRLLIYLGALLAFSLTAPLWLRLFELSRKRSWQRVARRLGLELTWNDRARSLRGTLEGVELDLVWQRRRDSLHDTSAGETRTSAASGLALRARPVHGTLDPEAHGPHLDAVLRGRRARLSERSLRWAPRRGSDLSGSRLEAVLRRAVAATREARRDESLAP